MTIYDQFRRENSNISNCLPLKIVNFETKIEIDHFSSFSRICSFRTKNGQLTHCVWHQEDEKAQFSLKMDASYLSVLSVTNGTKCETDLIAKRQ